MRCFIYVNFNNFSRNWKKICFPLGKHNFEFIRNFAYTAEFLTRGQALLILTLYLQMLIMQNQLKQITINTEEVLQLKKVLSFKKMGLKF